MDTSTTRMSDTSNEKMRDSSSGELSPEKNRAAGYVPPSHPRNMSNSRSVGIKC
jgi:hypothetical protein